MAKLLLIKWANLLMTYLSFSEMLASSSWSSETSLTVTAEGQPFLAAIGCDTLIYIYIIIALRLPRYLATTLTTTL